MGNKNINREVMTNIPIHTALVEFGRDSPKCKHIKSQHVILERTCQLFTRCHFVISRFHSDGVGTRDHNLKPRGGLRHKHTQSSRDRILDTSTSTHVKLIRA